MFYIHLIAVAHPIEYACKIEGTYSVSAGLMIYTFELLNVKFSLRSLSDLLLSFFMCFAERAVFTHLTAATFIL